MDRVTDRWKTKSASVVFLPLFLLRPLLAEPTLAVDLSSLELALTSRLVGKRVLDLRNIALLT